MRTSLAALLAVLALWRAVVDWQATLGHGYAYRFGKLGDLLVAWLPDGVGSTVGTLLLSIPVAPALAAVALAVWIGRPAQRSRTRW